MRILYPFDAPRSLGRAIVALARFDGVHRDHRRLAERAAERAGGARALAVAAVRWEGEAAGPGGLLTLLDERLALLEGLGRFDAAIVLARAPGAAPPEARDQARDQARRAAGAAPETMNALARLADVVGLLLDPEDDPEDGSGDPAAWGVPIERLEHGDGHERTTTGTQIAELLVAGDVRAAGMLLGHPYAVGGTVVSGDRRGRLLGYPTANLRLDPRKALPADGIYAVRARLPGERAARHPAVVSLGVRPQFGAGMPRLLEVFVLDAAPEAGLDLYGLPLAVEFVERLREERRFADVEALKGQMARDVGLARDVLMG